ncbi:MAG TPA: hypothetical protein PLL69_04215 [Gemmatimonadales bacterium]|nr:hypothetical protein [Gemmatimonadales bacterium]
MMDRSGRINFGCLIPLVLIAAFVYAAVAFGRPWFAYRQYQTEMRTVAGMQQSLSDSAIRVRITARADSLRLPPEAKRLTIKRVGEPSRLEISAKYSQTVTLPFIGEKVLEFRPTGTEAP